MSFANSNNRRFSFHRHRVHSPHPQVCALGLPSWWPFPSLIWRTGYPVPGCSSDNSDLPSGHFACYSFWVGLSTWFSGRVPANAGDAGVNASVPGSGRLPGGMATHPGIFVWKIPWAEEPGRPQSMGSWRVGHDLVIDCAHTPSQRGASPSPKAGLPPGPQVDLSPPHPCWPYWSWVHTLARMPHPTSIQAGSGYLCFIPGTFFSARMRVASVSLCSMLLCLRLLLKRFSPRLKVRASPGRRGGHSASILYLCPQLLPSLFSLLPLFLHPVSVSVCLSGLVSLFFCWFSLATLSPSSFLLWCHLHTLSPPPSPTPCWRSPSLFSSVFLSSPCCLQLPTFPAWLFQPLCAVFLDRGDLNLVTWRLERGTTNPIPQEKNPQMPVS